MMISGVLACALVASTAVPRVAAFTGASFDDISGRIDSEGGSSTEGFESSGSTKSGAGVKCSSDAWATTYSGFYNSYISAITHVVQDVCDPDWYGGVATSVDEVYGWASAYAKAAASSHASCSSFEVNGASARGCAYSEADSEAAASAYAQVHAKASAEAFAKYCTCANAEAWSFGEAELFIDLWATAYASSSSVACASGNQDSSASAYVDCYASVMAETYALAAAKASASAGCYYSHADAHARTEVEAIVDAHIIDTQRCSIIETDEGNAGSEGNGGADSGSTTTTP